MTTLTVGAALLMVALSMAGPVAAAGGCTLGPVPGSCVSGDFTYFGEQPGIDDSASTLIHGTVSSTIAETLFAGYSVTLTCDYDLGTLLGCAVTFGSNGGPWFGFPVEHTGNLNGVAVMGVDATYA